jgi:SOS-response transcriptional repressor LexA
MRLNKAVVAIMLIFFAGCSKQAIEEAQTLPAAANYEEQGYWERGNYSENITEHTSEKVNESELEESTKEASQEITQLNSSVAEDSLNQGKEKNYLLRNKTYNVTLAFVDENGARFLVNGKATQQIREGETDIVGDVEIGVMNSWIQNFEGGIRKVDYIIAFYK